MFPVIPELGNERKKDLENRLKALQKIDNKLRYQICLSDEDFKVYIKIYNKGEYDPYRELPIEYLDPNLTVRDLKPLTKNTLPEEELDNEETADKNYKPPANNILSKTKKAQFIKLRDEKKKFVTDLQISEFLHAYLAGTKCSPWMNFLYMSPEDYMELNQRAATPGPSFL